MSERQFFGLDIPTLVGYEVIIIEHGAYVRGIIESWTARNDGLGYFITFSSSSSGWPADVSYAVDEDTLIKVDRVVGDKTSKLEQYLAQAIANERRKNAFATFEDHRAAAAVIKAMEALVNADSKE